MHNKEESLICSFTTCSMDVDTFSPCPQTREARTSPGHHLQSLRQEEAAGRTSSHKSATSEEDRRSLLSEKKGFDRRFLEDTLLTQLNFGSVNDWDCYKLLPSNNLITLSFFCVPVICCSKLIPIEIKIFSSLDRHNKILCHFIASLLMRKANVAAVFGISESEIRVELEMGCYKTLALATPCYQFSWPTGCVEQDTYSFLQQWLQMHSLFSAQSCASQDRVTQILYIIHM